MLIDGNKYVQKPGVGFERARAPDGAPSAGLLTNAFGPRQTVPAAARHLSGRLGVVVVGLTGAASGLRMRRDVPVRLVNTDNNNWPRQRFVYSNARLITTRWRRVISSCDEYGMFRGRFRLRIFIERPSNFVRRHPETAFDGIARALIVVRSVAAAGIISFARFSSFRARAARGRC